MENCNNTTTSAVSQTDKALHTYLFWWNNCPNINYQDTIQDITLLRRHFATCNRPYQFYCFSTYILYFHILCVKLWHILKHFCDIRKIFFINGIATVSLWDLWFGYFVPPCPQEDAWSKLMKIIFLQLSNYVTWYFSFFFRIIKSFICDDTFKNPWRGEHLMISADDNNEVDIYYTFCDAVVWYVLCWFVLCVA